MFRLGHVFPAILLLLVTTAHAQSGFPSNFTPQESVDGAPLSPSRYLATHRSGAVGLTHTISAQKQRPGPTSLGVFLSGDYYSQSGFPAATFNTKSLDTNFGLSYTPNDWLETFLGWGFLKVSDGGASNPEYQQKNNITLGAKISYPFTPKISAGLFYMIEKRSAISNITGSQYALNHDLKAVATYDTQKWLRYHANLGLRVDNNLRLTNGSTANQRQLTALQAHGNNVLPLSLGAEFLIKWFSVSGEYSIDYVLQSNAGFASQPQRITLGTRVFPLPSQALALQLGIDFGLAKSTAVKTVVKEPSQTYHLGLSYLFGMKNKKRQTTEAPDSSFDIPKSELSKEKKTEEPETASNPNQVSGYVTNIETGEPVENAKIFLCDATNPIITDSSGSYHGYKLKEGSCEIRIERPGYKTNTETIKITDQPDQTFDFGLVQQTKEQGALMIRVKDVEGNPTAATISFPDNSDIKSVDTDEFGLIKIPLQSGEYSVKAKASNMKIQIKNVDLLPKQNIFVDFALEPEKTKKIAAPEETKKSTIKISKDKKSVEVSEKIQFEVNKAQVTDSSKGTIDDLATFLKKHPEIKKIQIGGHTDATGNTDKNLKLSQERAESIRDYLVEKGISAKRLEAKGFGQTKPISDNETDEGRQTNRRVEFRIMDLSKPNIKK